MDGEIEGGAGPERSKYDAITLDTNIFTNNHYNLDGGLLAQLEQFKDGTVQFVLSEVVAREVLRHITDRNSDERLKLDTAIKNTYKRKLVSDEGKGAIEAILQKEPSAEIVSRNRIRKFIQDTGAKIVSVSDVDAKQLTDMYFQGRPPFEKNAAKKSEFPDALALLSLEKWAKANGKKILAISKDKGWKAFAARSPHIDVKNDLASALSTFQDHLAEATAFITSLLEKFEAGNCPEQFGDIESRTLDQISNIYPMAEGESYYRFEDDGVELTGNSFEFIKNGDEYMFSIVQIGANFIVAKIQIDAVASATAHFNFSVYDEGEIGVGDCDANVEIEFESAIIVKFDVDLDSEEKEVFIEDVELVDTIRSVDFGSLEPDYSNEYRDDYDYDEPDETEEGSDLENAKPDEEIQPF